MARLINRHNSPVPAGSVYIGRGSCWGNPFIIGKHGSRREVITLYEQYIRNTPALLRRIPELVDKTLVCSCKPAPCHGDVLLKLIDEYLKKEGATK